MFYVYVLKSKLDDGLYIGYTDNLQRRFEEHKAGKVFSTKHRLPLELRYYEAYHSKADAKFREQQLKRFAQAYTQLKARSRNSLA